MSIKNTSILRVIIYEGPGAEPWEDTERHEVMTALLEKGYALTRATGTNGWSAWDRAFLLVLGRFVDGHPPETLNGQEDGQRMLVRDVRGCGVEEISVLAQEARREKEAWPQGAWKPWFPVIDYDRCTNCMQCLSFCLFDVYGVDEGQQIQVQHNDNCKTNCPACSRVCPEAAIMFPKYKSGPINGDVVSSQDLEREKMKVDISSLLGGDIYSMLRRRSEKAQSRFSKERSSDKALTERQKCLTKLAKEGDIPAEVIMSLPSPEEIQRRAEAARRKADAARAGGASPPNAAAEGPLPE